MASNQSQTGHFPRKPNLSPGFAIGSQVQERQYIACYQNLLRASRKCKLCRIYVRRHARALYSLSFLPIIAVHGGPGWPHNYMLPLKQQACRGRQVYFYDQAGCGASVLPPNTTVSNDYPWLLTMSYYAQEELPALIDHLELSEYHIIGSSWGTILAQLFALDDTTNSSSSSPNTTTNLASMVLSGPLSDGQFYMQAQWDEQDGTLGSLPPFVQERIRSLQAAQAYESPEYQAIDEIMTTKFVCRTAPLPDCFVASSDHANSEIYVGMQGPSEFSIEGPLGDFNSTGRLPSLAMPVLLTHGQYDTMRPAVVDVMYKAIPLAERLLLTKSGHVSMIDEPGTMNNGIADFFNRVEAARKLKRPFVPKPTDNDNSTTNSSSITSSSHPQSSFLLMGGTIVLAFCLGAFFGRRKSSQQRRIQYDVLL